VSTINPASNPVIPTHSSQSQFTTRLATAGYMATAGSSPSQSDTQSWYEAMAKAWGQALNNQAQVITDLSNQLNNNGQDQPSTITQLTTESLKFSFMATSASTATTSTGQGLDSLGRKQ
jgi:hypothetical protein